MTGVREPFHVLLGGEPERSERREPPDGSRREASVLQRKPDERDGREHGDDLRGVVEVRVNGARRRSGEAVGERVGRKDARRRDRRHECPGKRAASHVRGSCQRTRRRLAETRLRD